MYRVYIKDQENEYPLYEPLDKQLRIFNPILTQEMGAAGYFEFKIHYSHPFYKKIGVLKTEIIVYDNDTEIFCGRILKPETAMDNMVSITCEGELTYLLDSQQRPYEIEGSIVNFIDYALNIHNSQVDDFKKIHRGNIIVSDSNAFAVRSNTEFISTLEMLETKLVDIYGGYLKIRHENGKKYLDYLWDYGGINEQAIRFGENLLDLTHCIDATNLITCLIPIGAEIEEGKRTGIASVNGGLDYIQNEIAIKQYGKIWGQHTWDEITDEKKLLKEAQNYLKEMSQLPSAIEVTAIDLSRVKNNVKEFELGCWTEVISEPHGIETKYMLTKRVINLLDPTQGSINLGTLQETFSESVAKGQTAIKQVGEEMQEIGKDIEKKIENANNLITGGLGGYVVIDCINPSTGEQMHPHRILIMNTPDKTTSKNVIQINQNGIGFSTNGINGPYTNAWTIDGNLIANFITTGNMLADRIRGGTLELGGTGLGKDGVLLIRDARGKEIGRFDKNGITINKGNINMTSGSINLGKFRVDSNGVLNLDGTSNNTTIGADVVNANHLQIWDKIEASGASFNIGGMWSSGSYVHGSFMGDFHGNFYELSDFRKKENIKPLKDTDALEIMLKLRPVEFTMKNTKERKIGFVAQEVEKQQKKRKQKLPLTSKDNEGFYCIPYTNYIALLTGALKAQQKQINMLLKAAKKEEENGFTTYTY